MVQPGGESNPAGDSEHHTSMHVPHGTKQQEEEEEELKWVPFVAWVLGFLVAMLTSTTFVRYRRMMAK